MQPLPDSLFLNNTLEVARELIGKRLEVGPLSGRIVETEAYRSDGASHARRYTPRSAPMFDTYGQLYIYLIYGVHHCLNITTEPPEHPGAVLIRALEPLEGIEVMAARRGTSNPYQLCSGPGKLCQALAITLEESGRPLGERVRIGDDGLSCGEIRSVPRVGVRRATALKWRFLLSGSPYVSHPNPGIES